MKKSGQLLIRISNSSAFTVLSLWFFSEMAFNILPIVIILVINFAFSESFQKILLLPDWSFASIVLCGGALSLLIELKTKFQKDSSHKIYTGTRLLTLVLIGSVISLTLALLLEKGVGINSNFLGILQIALFGFSALAPLVPLALREEFLDTYNMPAESAGVFHLMDYLSFSLGEANDNLRHSVVTLSKNRRAINKRCQSSLIGSDFDSEKKHIENLIIQLEEALIHFKNEWKDVAKTEKLIENGISEN